METFIISVESLPTSPFNGTGTVGIVITSGVPSYLKVTGTGLDGIVDTQWYPENPTSVKFVMKQLTLLNPQEAVCMVMVTDNYLNNNNRAGYLSFRLTNGITISFSVETYGPVSYQSLWRPNQEGLNTG
jgi:hypothetical protein